MLPMNSLNRKINKTELNSKTRQLQTTGHFSCFFCLFVASSCNTLITFSHQELTGIVLCLNPDFTSDWTDQALHLLFQQVMQTAQETRARMKSCLSNPAAKPKQAMSIQRRRLYLPHELTLTIVTIVYIRPNANVSTQRLPTYYKWTAERDVLGVRVVAGTLISQIPPLFKYQWGQDRNINHAYSAASLCHLTILQPLSTPHPCLHPLKKQTWPDDAPATALVWADRLVHLWTSWRGDFHSVCALLH